MSPSETILAQNEAVLARMLRHPFVRAIEAGTLPAAAFDRYLVHEGGFVQTAIAIFAYATAKAPDLEARRWLIGVQGALAQDQMAYFEETLAARGVDTAIAVPPGVAAFDSGMLTIARTGDFLEIVTAMFAAEWMYGTWCSRAARSPIADPHIRVWVNLHADAAFAAQVRWLAHTIDSLAAAGDVARLSAIFARVTELEIAFHDAALSALPEPTDA